MGKKKKITELSPEEKFKQDYCEESKISVKFFDKHFVVLPCNCGNKDCPKWAVVVNDKNSIRRHKVFYGVK